MNLMNLFLQVRLPTKQVFEVVSKTGKNCVDLYYRRCSFTEFAAVGTDGAGDRSKTDDEPHIPDAMTQRLEALAKRLAIEQKVSDCYCVSSFTVSKFVFQGLASI